MIINDTIVACATPSALPSALSVVRLSGPDSKNILQNLIKKDISKIVPRHAHYLKLYNEEELLDEAIVIFFAAPNSFTGDDTVEFYLHGSPYIAQNVIKATLKYGACLAKKGEFTLKAVLHGKMPLIEAERINTLIHAPTLEAEQKVIKKDPAVLLALEDIEKDVTYLNAYFLQMLDYPEEYTDEEEKSSKMLNDLRTKIIKLRKATSTNNYFFNGVKVVIIGQPNVGKSTLLNKILGEDKAIVTSIEGTTRDIVEGQKEIDGVLYSFYDTAGIRKTDEEIEKIGISKSLAAVNQADIILLLSDTGHFEEDFQCSLKEILKDKKVLKVATKNDLGKSTWNEADIKISSHDKDCSALFSKFQELLDLSDKSSVGLYTTRDLSILDKLETLMNQIIDDFSKEQSYDLVSIAMQEAWHLVKSLAGKEYNPDEIYDEVFASFCVGK